MSKRFSKFLVSNFFHKGGPEKEEGEELHAKLSKAYFFEEPRIKKRIKDDKTFLKLAKSFEALFAFLKTELVKMLDGSSNRATATRPVGCNSASSPTCPPALLPVAT